MQPKMLVPTRAALTERIAAQWRGPLLQLAVAWAILLAIFAGNWAAMVLQWWDSSTYNHILLIPAILVWLVWQRADELAKLTPLPWWPGLVALAGAMLVWLLGDLSGLATASQLGAVAMMIACVPTLLGPRISYALAFPLFYALFMVPIGDELVPALQMITAGITIWLTIASGIPAVVDGVFIDTPIGLFEVAEACSGVKFLIAMVALGAMVSHVCFRSWWRRMAFMGFAIALPILANGVRAWGTIYIAQSQGLEFAAGFDHIFYGWVFFALVLALLLGASWRWFDRQVEDPVIDAAAISQIQWLSGLEKYRAQGWQCVALVAFLTLGFVSWSGFARQVEAPLPYTLSAPEVPGWRVVSPEQAYPWEPPGLGSDRRLLVSYSDGEGAQVDLFYSLYGAQDDGREAGGYGQNALPPDTAWRWLAPEEPVAGALGDRLQALGTHQRVTMTWYRHGDWLGSSRIKLKLLTMRDSLLLQEQATAMMILSAQEGEGLGAREAIEKFVQSTGPTASWMDRVAGLD